MKKIKRSAVLIIAFCFAAAAFAGCTESGSSESANHEKTYEQIAASLTFIDEMPETDLPRPEREIGSREEFIDALDYLSFYRVNEEVSFEISEEYASTFYNAYQEFSLVCEISQLSDFYPIFLSDEYYAKYRILSVDFRIRDFADDAPTVLPDSVTVVYPFDYTADLNERGENFEDFPLVRENKGEVAVENSEQLWYAANRGYLPVPKEGSVADEIFSEAKNVLRRIISDDMTDLEKLKAIYNYLCCEIRYDRATANSGAQDLISAQCYYLEGVFLNRLAVCDGKAKAYCLLAAMEGIPVLRATAEREDFSGHAYNYVQLEEKWYLSCTTFGSNELNFGSEEQPDIMLVSSYNMFLTTYETPYGDEGWGYDSGMYPEIAEVIETEAFDYWAQEFSFPNGKTLDLTVSDYSELSELAEAVLSLEAEGSIQFEFRAENGFSADGDVLDKLSEDFANYDIRLIQNRPLDAQLYGCILTAAKY